MTNSRVLPKPAYSLDDAVKYISQNHNIDISKKDLIEYIQNEELQASIYVCGNVDSLYSINKKSIGNKISTSIIRLIVSETNICNRQFRNYSTDAPIPLEIHNDYFFLSVYIDADSEDYRNLLTYQKFWHNQKSKPLKLAEFSGYMHIYPYEFSSYNVDELLEKNYISDINSIFFNDSFSIQIEIKDHIKIQLNDIVILHNNLIKFLEMFSIIDSSYSHPEEIKKLTDKIKELEKEILSKDKTIEELSSQKSKKPSPASDNKKNAFIKSLLYIHYGEKIAENPRPHVHDPNSSPISANGAIQRSFDENGLSKHLPTGKTLLNWVKGIELDIKE
ncbi:hypothetical protein [Otariodibacter oris]|uniref:SlyX protein n=1 Tax=Otariodibacter oris TaxID=1032623 RepID=A0A420XJ18_9PAST|nr:hypothetical protein [Otariodibacter oris]QGM80710.1 hypothetical protein A6A10_04470 [Otariodibacter oris]RKR77128.1 hypothetical protein DES31_0450 [Otariodibacter oris]